MGALGGAVRRRIADWPYAESGKGDRRLDFLRGYCVFAMAVDHLAAKLVVGAADRRQLLPRLGG